METITIRWTKIPKTEETFLGEMLIIFIGYFLLQWGGGGRAWCGHCQILVGAENKAWFRKTSSKEAERETR